MAFKGVLPSDLWDRYDREDGWYRLQLDMHIAAEINDMVAEAHAKAEKGHKGAGDANAMVARRNQKRKQYLSNTDDFFSAVEKAGVPVRKSGDDV